LILHSIRNYKLEITVKIEEHKLENLNPSAKKMVQNAKLASDSAYAPYSQFYVGCSVKLADGSMVLGSNQENASFPSGLCAERVALFECAKNLQENEVLEIAVYARSSNYKVPKLLVPCAACLQVISDIQNRQKATIKIWMWSGSEEVFLAKDVSQFLPFHFELEKL
jgi:cytidine deaminase